MQEYTESLKLLLSQKLFMQLLSSLNSIMWGIHYPRVTYLQKSARTIISSFFVICFIETELKRDVSSWGWS